MLYETSGVVSFFATSGQTIYAVEDGRPRQDRVRYRINDQTQLDVGPGIQIRQVQITTASRAGAATGSFVIRYASDGDDTEVTLD